MDVLRLERFRKAESKRHSFDRVAGSDREGALRLFGGKQARMPLLVSNRGYGIAAAASRTALLCNVRTFGTYLHTAGDGQIDYYFILGKDREEIVKQYKEL